MKVFTTAALVIATDAAVPFPAGKGDGSWQWVDVPGSKCMDGKETGVYVRHSVSGNKNVGVYLNGGGACWNTITCATAASSAHPGIPGTGGLFASRTDNPLNDYNWINVPYCTGDVHGGDTNTTRAGRQFNGVPNLKLFMDKAAASFPDAETQFITGESAGGFGALTTYATLRSYFPNARGVLMDDSGPVLDDTAIPVCLQEAWRNTWNLNKNLPKDCSCNNDAGNLVSAWSYGRKAYPKDSFSLISSVNDATISTFFAFGNNDCKAILPIGYNKLHAGLESLATSGVPVYMIPGSSHTHTGSNEFFSRTVAGQVLYKWIAQLMDPNQPDPSTVRPTAEDYLNEETTGARPSTVVV